MAIDMLTSLVLSAFRGLWKIVLMATVLTILGQVTYKGDSLENRYHEWVNSGEFQKKFWVAMTPLTWTTDKIQELVSQAKPDISTR